MASQSGKHQHTWTVNITSISVCPHCQSCSKAIYNSSNSSNNLLLVLWRAGMWQIPFCFQGSAQDAIPQMLMDTRSMLSGIKSTIITRYRKGSTSPPRVYTEMTPALVLAEVLDNGNVCEYNRDVSLQITRTEVGSSSRCGESVPYTSK